MNSKIRAPTLRQIRTMVKSYFPHHSVSFAVDDITHCDQPGESEQITLYVDRFKGEFSPFSVMQLSMGSRVTAGTQRRLFVAAAEITGFSF